MSRPTAAAGAASSQFPSRRAVLSAGAALAVSIAVLPEAEAAGRQDAALLKMGLELDALWTRELELAAESKRLHDLAWQIRPAPEPGLLAYEHEGRLLFEPQENGRYWVDFGVQREAMDIERCWRVLGFREGPCPEADILVALERWWIAGDEAESAVGATATREELERVTEIAGDLCGRIIAEPAQTPAGLKVKLRALDWCYSESSHGAAIAELRDDEEGTKSDRLIASALGDAIRMLGLQSL